MWKWEVKGEGIIGKEEGRGNDMGKCSEDWANILYAKANPTRLMVILRFIPRSGLVNEKRERRSLMK